MSIHPDRPTEGDVVIEHVERVAKFKKTAEGRLNAVIRGLRLLERCANRRTYAYNNEQVEKMFAAIREQLDSCEKAYRAEERARNEWVSL